MKIIIALFVVCNVFITYSDWQLLNSNTNKNLYCIYFVNVNTGFVAGEVLLKTTDSGLNWETVLDSTLGFNIKDISFLNASTGYFVNNSSRIYKTTDGGNIWFPNGVNNIAENIYQVRYVNDSTGFITTSNHAAPFPPSHYIYKTTNSGYNWIQFNNIGNDATEFLKLNSDTLVLSAGSKVYISLNSGALWYGITVFNDIIIFDCFNIQEAYCKSSYNGVLYRSTNGCQNWQQLSNSFINKGFVVSANNLLGITNYSIFNSTDSGVTWNLQFNQYLSIYDIKFVNANTGFVCGNSGVIYKTTNNSEPFGINPISSEIPATYALSQNFPNPFNPSTNIKFQIPASRSAAQTFLFVYDALGREVATLVNQQLQPGTYEVDWDASAYPSGVYFYCISSGDYIETKKMVLIK